MKLNRIIDIIAIIAMGFIFSRLFTVLVNTKPILGFNLIKRDYVFYLFYFLIFIRAPRVYFTDTMKLIYLYYILFFLMRVSGYYDVENQWFMDWHYPVFSAVLIHNYYVYSRDHRSYARVILATLIIIAITAIVNIYVLIRYPEVARQLFGDESVLGGFGGGIYAIGLGTYAFTSSIPFIIPMLVVFYKVVQGTGLRIAIVVFNTIILVSVFMSAITAPILMAALCLLFALAGRKRLGASILVSAALLLLIVVVPTSAKSDFFYSISDLVTQKDLSRKMKDIGYVIETGVDTSNPMSTVEYRAGRIPKNLAAFATNPVFGTGHEVEFHIFWLNRLAQVGLLGTLPLILILFHHMKLCIRRCDPYIRFYMLVSFLLFIVLGFMKNTSGRMFYYPLLLVPGMYYLKYLKRDYKSDANHERSSIVAETTNVGENS
jgi:hypothetical protein